MTLLDRIHTKTCTIAIIGHGYVGLPLALVFVEAGFTPFYPGPGLGGHCIPLDPFYPSWKAAEYGIWTRFTELAGEINTHMPNFVVEKTVKEGDAPGPQTQPPVEVRPMHGGVLRRTRRRRPRHGARLSSATRRSTRRSASWSIAATP